MRGSSSCDKCIGLCECGDRASSSRFGTQRSMTSLGMTRTQSTPAITRSAPRPVAPLSLSSGSQVSVERGQGRASGHNSGNGSPRPVSVISKVPAPPQAPVSPRVRPVTMAASVSSVPKAPDLFPGSASATQSVFPAVCQQLALCAKRQGPDTPLGGAVGRLVAGAKNWQAMIPFCSYQDCIDLLVHALRSLDASLVTPELCRWATEAEMVADEEHRFQLLFSLINVLPPANRAMMMQLTEGLAGFPSVMALQLGPALLGLPASMPSGHALVKFLVALPAWASQVEPCEPGSWQVGSCPLGKVLGLVADPYYCGMIEPGFGTLVADMHAYMWPSPEAAVLAIGEALRRFMRPGAWAVEARCRLVVFATEFVRRLGRCDPPLRSNRKWKDNWAWLLQLLVHPLNVEGEDVPQSHRDNVKALVNFMLPPDEIVRPPPLNVSPGSMEQPLLETSPKAVAKVIQRLLLTPFGLLSVSHLIKQRWMTPALSPPFAHLVSLFNGLQSWAVSWILEPARSKDRSAHLTWVLKCAHHCKKTNNLHAAMALFLAASDPAISRLARTWKDVPSKGQAYLAELKALADPKNNHQCYANAVKAASVNPPVIPYMALVSKYLFSMGDANPDVIEATGFVNLSKFRMMRNFILSVLSLKERADEVLAQPVSVADASLLAFFTSCCNGTYDNAALYELSLEREPRTEATARPGGGETNNRLSEVSTGRDSVIEETS